MPRGAQLLLHRVIEPKILSPNPSTTCDLPRVPAKLPPCPSSSYFLNALGATHPGYSPRPPWALCSRPHSQPAQPCYATAEARLALLPSATAAAIVEYMRATLGRGARLVLYSGGNLNTTEAKRLFADVHKALGRPPPLASLPPLLQCVHLPSGTAKRVTAGKNKNDENAAVDIYWQVGADVADLGGRLALLEHLMHEYARSRLGWRDHSRTHPPIHTHLPTPTYPHPPAHTHLPHTHLSTPTYPTPAYPHPPIHIRHSTPATPRPPLHARHSPRPALHAGHSTPTPRRSSTPMMERSRQALRVNGSTCSKQDATRFHEDPHPTDDDST